MPSPSTARERGTAIVVVLAVLVLILAFMAANHVTLRSLHREMQLIEQRQLRKYQTAEKASGTTRRAEPVGAESAVAASPSPP